MGDTPLSLQQHEFIDLLASRRRPTVVDVRPQDAYDISHTLIATAIRRDPHAVHEWSGGLSTDRDVIVYCIHGHRMSQSVAALLRSSGVAARYLVGGIDGFVEAGGPTFGGKNCQRGI